MPWQNNLPKNIATERALKELLMHNPDVQKAMKTYVNSLNLQGQVNEKIMTPEQATRKFYDAHQEFLDGLTIAIHNKVQDNQFSSHPDTTDYSNPDSVSSALQNPNPNSLLSESVNASYAVLDDMLAQNTDQNTAAMMAEEEEQTQLQQQQTEQPEEAQEETQSAFRFSYQDSDKSDDKEDEKISGLFAAIDKKDQHDITKALEDVTGFHADSTDLFKDAAEEEVHSLFSTPTPKPPTES